MAYSGPTIRSSAAFEPAAGTTTSATHTITTSGSTVIVMMTCSGGSANTFVSITGGGYTWSTVEHHNASNNRKVGIYKADNVSSGSLTATITWSGSVTCHMCVFEVSPATVDTSSYIDHSLIGITTSFHTASSPGITSTTNVLLLAAAVPSAAPTTITEPTGYTMDTSSVSGSYIRGVAHLASEAGVSSHQGTFTLGTARNGIGAIVSLKNTVATGTTLRQHRKSICNYYYNNTYNNKVI